MTGKPPDDHRPSRWRKLRSVAVLTATALAAPLGFVAATTSPASAAPGDALPLVVSGDAAARNTLGPGAWTWEGSDFVQLKSLIQNTSVRGVTFDTTSVPSVSAISYGPGTLDNVDVYFAGAVGGGGDFGYSPAEEQALQRWVRDGGVLIANTNNRDFDVTRFLGDDPNYRERYEFGSFVEVKNPRAYFDNGNDCGANLASNPGGSCPAPQASPRLASVPNSGIGAGVGTIRNWHTVTAFEESTLPNGAQVIARLTLTCDEMQVSCAEQAPDPLPQPPEPAWRQSYNNNLGTNVPVVAYVPFDANPALFGSGAVVLTSDVDTFSNAYPLGAGQLQGGNRILAQNIFNAIANHYADDADRADANARYVRAAYVTLLRRTPAQATADAAGVEFWANQLTNGSLTRGQFALALAQSSEWRAVVVNDMYTRIFGRGVDAGGLAYWSSQLANGMRVSDMAKNVYASDEYFINQGGGNLQVWVGSLYSSILGRGGEAAGVSYWVGAVQSGSPRAAAANALFLSYESNVRRVDALYQSILGRGADADGRAYWGQLLVSLDDINLAALLVESNEYYAART